MGCDGLDIELELLECNLCERERERWMFAIDGKSQVEKETYEPICILLCFLRGMLFLD